MNENRSFANNILAFRTKLQNRENFSFSKYADGEWAVMQNHSINNKEFWFDPNSEKDQEKRQALIESFKYKHPNYYVGISCPCCQGIDTFNSMREFSEQDDDHLTWANLWVNSNYKTFINKILPLFSDRDIVLFHNKRGNISKLPFKPYVTFPLNDNSWEHDWEIAEQVNNILNIFPIENAIFLFCCGPFGNILCHRFTQICDKNTYLDIGSTLNPFLGSAGFERHYYQGNNFFSNLTCQWGQV
jgi:hypothetical protein